MIDMRSVYGMLKRWFKETFGTAKDPNSIIVKLQEEVNELNMAVQTHSQWQTHENREAVREEIADVTMVLFRLSQRYGICYDSFLDAIIAKHNVNKIRKWVEMPDGSWKHLPDDMEIKEQP